MFLNLLLIMFGVWIVYDDRTADRLSELGEPVGWFFIVICGLGVFSSLRFSFYTPATLVTTAEGVTVKTDFNPAYGPIKWCEIGGFEVVERDEDHDEFLLIHLHAPGAIWDRLGRWPMRAFVDRRPSDPIELPDYYFGGQLTEVALDLAELWQLHMPEIEVHDPSHRSWRGA